MPDLNGLEHSIIMERNSKSEFDSFQIALNSYKNSTFTSKKSITRLKSLSPEFSQEKKKPKNPLEKSSLDFQLKAIVNKDEFVLN